VAAGAAGSALVIEAGRQAAAEPQPERKAEGTNGHRPERVPVGALT
jgi:hypothetical protein